MIFTGDNWDMKFPHRVPIIPQTHETKLPIFDASHSTCVSAVSTLNMLYDLQAAVSTAAGYFGGYTAKVQNIGTQELKRLQEALERKVDSSKSQAVPKLFQEYSKRLLKDLEAKSTIRTAVESLNLSCCAAAQDVLKAECIRTFATVTFPAAELLRREEIETQRSPGKSIIKAVHHSRGEGLRTWTQAPFDLMYGFRGRTYAVDLLSSYEMIRYWTMERILPPSNKVEVQTSAFTKEGRRYLAQCKKNGDDVVPKPGVHYVAIAGEDRLLLPDLPHLNGLRHRWCWQLRDRPYVPVWNFAKMPRATLPSEENSRLLSLYMRPWTLNSDDVAEHNPLLTDLRRAETAEVDNVSARRTYVLGWRWYIQGHVTSQQQRRFIQNLLMATAAKVAEQPGEVSSDSEEVDYKRHERTIGDMKLVHRTIDGLQADDEDTEQGPFGQYFECISRGRALWQSAPLSDSERALVNVSVDGYILSDREAKKALHQFAELHSNERQAPFEGATQPHAIVRVSGIPPDTYRQM